ncbi:MAG: glycosyltransferase [Bacteroidota bacterium]|nr:glycosyltransferase [Bacteroidota bacterium]
MKRSENIMVSIYMITYNHEKYITQAIDSILTQNVQFNYEIVIGEDCSQDSTRSIIMEFAQKFPGIFNLILQEHNVGIFENQMAVFKACRGKYIALLEGDDYWTDPFKLQKQVDFMEANPEYGMVHTDFDEKRDSVFQNYNRCHSLRIPEGNIFDNLLGDQWLIHTPTIMVRAVLIKEYRTFYYANIEETQKWLFDDIGIFLYVASRSKIKYFDYSTAVYRILEESCCHSKSWHQRLLNGCSLYDIKLFFVRKYNVKNQKIVRSLMTGMNKTKLRIAFLEHNLSEAVVAFYQLLKYRAPDFKDCILFVGSFSFINLITGKIQHNK